MKERVFIFHALEDLANAVSALTDVCELVVDPKDARIMDAKVDLVNARRALKQLRTLINEP